MESRLQPGVGLSEAGRQTLYELYPGESLETILKKPKVQACIRSLNTPCFASVQQTADTEYKNFVLNLQADQPSLLRQFLRKRSRPH
jgi:hypothetical protein